MNCDRVAITKLHLSGASRQLFLFLVMHSTQKQAAVHVQITIFTLPAAAPSTLKLELKWAFLSVLLTSISASFSAGKLHLIEPSLRTKGSA